MYIHTYIYIIYIYIYIYIYILTHIHTAKLLQLCKKLNIEDISGSLQTAAILRRALNL